MPVDEEQLHDLLYQAHETELGGVQIYEAARGRAQKDVAATSGSTTSSKPATMSSLSSNRCGPSGSIPPTKSPGRKVVRHTGEALVKTISLAQGEASPDQAQVVAAECVTLAETKDHLNWELIGHVVTTLLVTPPRCCAPRTKKWPRKRTSTCTTTRAGPGSSGSKGLASRRCCRPLRNKRKSRPPSGPHGLKQARQDMT